MSVFFHVRHYVPITLFFNVPANSETDDSSERAGMRGGEGVEWEERYVTK